MTGNNSVTFSAKNEQIGDALAAFFAYTSAVAASGVSSDLKGDGAGKAQAGVAFMYFHFFSVAGLLYLQNSGSDDGMAYQDQANDTGAYNAPPPAGDGSQQYPVSADL